MTEMKKSSVWHTIIHENPVFSLYLGLCGCLAVSSTINNALGMAVCVFVVLLFSEIIISLIRKIVPNEIRIPVFIVIIASMVEVVEMLIHAYAPTLYESLGSFLSLIVVNCIILGRAESCASKNGVGTAIKDACIMGLGYFVAIMMMGIVRQVLAVGTISLNNPFTNGELFSLRIIPEAYTLKLFGTAVGSFITFGLLAGLFSYLKKKEDKKEMEAAK